jgi:hypothetical protein
VKFTRDAVVQDLAGALPAPNAGGLLEVHGVYLGRLPLSFWRELAASVTEAASPRPLEAAWRLLHDVAREAAYCAGRDVMSSEPWRTLVRPRLRRRPEDDVSALLAVLSAWGWGRLEPVEVDADHLVVRADVRLDGEAETDGAGGATARRWTEPFLCGFAAACQALAFGDDGPKDLRRWVGRRVEGAEDSPGLMIVHVACDPESGDK